MNIPKSAQAILRKFRRRGFDYATTETGTTNKGRWYGVCVERSKGHSAYYSKRHPTVLACCHDIEKQWRADHDT